MLCTSLLLNLWAKAADALFFASEINFYKHVTKNQTISDFLMTIQWCISTNRSSPWLSPGAPASSHSPNAFKLGNWWLWIVTMWMCVVVSPYISALVSRVYPTSPLIAARTGSSPQMTLYRIGGDKKWMDGQIDGYIAINLLKWKEPL